MKMMRHVWLRKSPAWPKKKFYQVLAMPSMS